METVPTYKASIISKKKKNVFPNISNRLDSAEHPFSPKATALCFSDKCVLKKTAAVQGWRQCLV